MSEETNVVNALQSPDVAEKQQPQPQESDKERNFRKLEAAREAEREARIRAEMHAEAMKREIESIKEMLQPKETDPLDEVDDDDLKARLKAQAVRERSYVLKEAEKIADRRIEEKLKQNDKNNFLLKLRNQYQDYDQVMNESNIAKLSESDPVFLQAVLKIDDDFERRALTYEYMKSKKPSDTPKPSIKERVEENQRNPYYIPPGSGNPTSAVDFDVKSPQARKAAYDKLKAAQRKPIGSGFGAQKA